MRSEADARLALAEKLNGAEANLQLAKSRHYAAKARLDEVEKSRKDFRDIYTDARAKLDTKLTAGERLAVIKEINVCLEQIAERDRDLQRAKSEEGTAAKEVAKYGEECESFARELLKLLPDALLVSP